MWDLIFTVIHDLQAVVEKDSRQIRRHGGHIDPRIRICFADERERSDMIHVGMTDQDRVQPAMRLDNCKVGEGIFCPGLPDPAVHKDPLPCYVQIYTASANLHGAA